MIDPAVPTNEKQAEEWYKPPSMMESWLGGWVIIFVTLVWLLPAVLITTPLWLPIFVYRKLVRKIGKSVMNNER